MELNLGTFFIFAGALALVATAFKLCSSGRFLPGGLLTAAAGVLMLVGAPIADRAQASFEEQVVYGDNATVVADATPGWYTVLAWLLIAGGLVLPFLGAFAKEEAEDAGGER